MVARRISVPGRGDTVAQLINHRFKGSVCRASDSLAGFDHRRQVGDLSYGTLVHLKAQTPFPGGHDNRRGSDGWSPTLDGVSNPDNVGAIFRTASALGVHGIVLSPECASPLYRKAIRTSMGAALRLPFSHGPAWDEAVSGMQARGYLLLALTPASEARRLDDVAVALPGDRPRALLLGAEGLGLRTSSLTAADIRVRIPMSGGVDSLNVAAAAAVALYRLRP